MDPQTTPTHLVPQPLSCKMLLSKRNELSNPARNMSKSAPNHHYNSGSVIPPGFGLVGNGRQDGSFVSEKISGSDNVLHDGSSPPLQGTEIITLQGCPTTTIVAETSAFKLNLPHELVERILILLDTKSMLKCRLVNREFNEVIRLSTLLQYFLVCKAAGVVDNPHSPLSCAEKLEALKLREDAWRKVNPMFETTIQVYHRESSTFSFYYLNGGVYFLSDDNQHGLCYCHLPSSPQDNPRWIRLPGHGHERDLPGIFITFAIAIYEHDLLINVISPDTNQVATQHHTLDMVLLKFSTGEYHPLARLPRIQVQVSSSARAWVIPRVVGNNLALIVQYYDGAFPDQLLIFDWKTGYKRLNHETTEDAYSGLVFISPELLLVPNRALAHFEFWHLPPFQPDYGPPVQILSLKIPAVSPDYFLLDFTCHGEPEPFLHSVPHSPPRPFFSSSENSIIVVNLRFRSGSHFGRQIAYRLIVHRRALLNTIQKWTIPQLLGKEDLAMWLTNESTVHEITDPDDELVRLGAQSRLVPMAPHPKPSSPTRGSPSCTESINAESGSSCITSGSSATPSTSKYNFFQVQWADWGPPISRWFHVPDSQSWRITTSAGQRYAFSQPHPRDGTKLMVNVADFNMHNFRRNAEMISRSRLRSKGEDDDNISESEGEELEILDHKGIFSEDVYMGLKCVVYPAPGQYDFDVVLMDEERLLGLKLNHEDMVESIKVLYIG